MTMFHSPVNRGYGNQEKRFNQRIHPWDQPRDFNRNNNIPDRFDHFFKLKIFIKKFYNNLSKNVFKPRNSVGPLSVVNGTAASRLKRKTFQAPRIRSLNFRLKKVRFM